MNELPTNSTISEGIDAIVAFASNLQTFFTRLVTQATQAWERADRAYGRAALLKVYKRRRQWKKSDLRHLQTYNLNAAALRRMDRIKLSNRLGRPVVGSYRPLADVIGLEARNLLDLDKDALTPSERLQRLKTTSLWPYVIEALYRGEHAVLKSRHEKAASDSAERAVARALIVSPEVVRKRCGQVRRRREQGTAMLDLPPFTVCAFEAWKLTGQIPDEI